MGVRLHAMVGHAPVAGREPGHRQWPFADDDGASSSTKDTQKRCTEHIAALRDTDARYLAYTAYMATAIPAPAAREHCTETAQSLLNEYEEALHIESSLFQRHVRTFP